MGGPGSGRKPRLIYTHEYVPASEAVGFDPNVFLTVGNEGMPAFVVTSAANSEGVTYNTLVLTVLPDDCQEGERVWVNRPERINLAYGSTLHLHRIPGEIVALHRTRRPFSLALIRLADFRKYGLQVSLVPASELKDVGHGTKVIAVTRSRQPDPLVAGRFTRVWRSRFVLEHPVIEYADVLDEPAFIVLARSKPLLLDIWPLCSVTKIRGFLADAGIKAP